MGGSSSKPTVLDSTIKKFKKGFAGDSRVKRTPGKLHDLGELSWPSFDVGWLPEGPTVQAMHQVLPGTPGHPDQFPYRDYWLLITQTIPHGQDLARTDRDRVGYLWPNHSEKKKEEGKKKSIFQGDPVKTYCCPHQTFSTPQASAEPALDPLSDSPLPSMSPTPPHKQDSSPKPVEKQLCLAKQSNQLVVAHQMLLQETQGPQQVNEDSSVQPGCSILYYQPFSTTDLLNWKHHNPAYSDKPQAMTDLLESTFHTISLHGKTVAGSLCLSSLLKKGDASQQKPQNGSKEKSPQSSKM